MKHENAWPVTYLPAFGVCASGIELLGRCLNGNTSTSGCVCDLTTGLEWLRSSSPQSGAPQSAIAVTSYTRYDIDLLVTLRHFTAHGQATKAVTRALAIDIELLNAFPWLIGNAMEKYWYELLNSDTCRRNLADASVIPLRSDPIKKMWDFFQKEMAAGDPFYKFVWQVR